MPIIRAARQEYAETLKRILAIERQIGNGAPKELKLKPEPQLDLNEELIPRNRLFTLNEVVDLMKRVDPLRRVHVPTVLEGQCPGF